MRSQNTRGVSTIIKREVDSQLRPDPWPEAFRAMSNVVLRSALFSVNPSREIARTRQLISAGRGLVVRFKGERLNQYDLDLWEFLLHRARSIPLESPVTFCAHEAMLQLGRSTGGAAYEDFKEDIARLVAAYVEITRTDTGKTFFGTLLKSGTRDEVTQRYAVVFDTEIYNLFRPQHYTLIDVEQRKGLGKNVLAKWLHGFYSSHAPGSAHRYKVETIRSLCGAKQAAADSPRLSKTVVEKPPRLCDFRKQLILALNKMKAKKVIVSWKIDPKTDCLTVGRRATASQLRHIEKREATSEKLIRNSQEFSDGPGAQF
jgi:hypothetical protein